MRGTSSGTTQTINVTVADDIYTVEFDSQGGSSVADRTVADGFTLSDIPSTTKQDYSLEGWYTGTNGTGTRLTSQTVFTSSTPKKYYAYWVQGAFVCRIATTLHQESCTRSSGGCFAAGYDGQTITYGQLVASPTMNYGDAYDCDVNADGDYDEEKERFYYIGTNNGNAALIHYKSTQHVTDQDYDTASAALPTSSMWANSNLVTFSGTKVSRFLKRSEVQTVCNKNMTLPTQLGYNGNCVYLLEQSNFATTTKRDGIWLEKEGTTSYRIQTATDQVTSNTQANTARAVIEVPLDLVETGASSYSISFDSEGGTTVSDVYTVTAGQEIGRLPQEPTRTNYVFQGWFENASGGTAITTHTVPTGDTVYHAQWKKAVTLAELERNSVTLAEGNTITINVTNASDLEPYTFTSNDGSIATVNSSTGVITAVAEGSTYITMEGTGSHTTKTINVTVVDASSVYTLTYYGEGGLPATSQQTVSVGSPITTFPQQPTRTNYVFMGWFTSASGGDEVTTATVPQDDDDYHAQWKLNVQQATIGNTDFEMLVGENLTINVTNSSELEPYTFSSNDTSVATVNANTGVVTGAGIGITEIVMTGTRSNLTKEIEIEVTAPTFTVTFDTNGGIISSPETDEMEVEENTEIGSLPTPTRTNYKFFGWYKDNGTFYQEVYPDEVIEDDVTFYAKWVEDTTNFPIVWSEINACTFTGTANVSGQYCASANKAKKYIDTGIAMFNTQDNYDKDFEVGFTIVTYDPAANSNQATFVNAKSENSSNNYPGFVVRRYTSTENIEVTAKWKGDNGFSYKHAYDSIHSVRVVRRTENINGEDHIKIYYGVDGGALIPAEDITNVTHVLFDTTVWFGASATSKNAMQRPLVGTLTDMYVRLGTDADYIVDFDPNGGQVSTTSVTVAKGSAMGNLLPTPTPPDANSTFDGWYDESVSPAVAVTSLTVPDGNKTYVAHYTTVSPSPQNSPSPMMSNLLSQSIQQDPEQSPDLQANNNNQQNNISGSGVINSDSTGTTTGGTPLKSSSYTSYGPAQAVASEPAPVTAAEVAVMATATTAATAGALLLARASKTAAKQQAINYFTSQKRQ